MCVKTRFRSKVSHFVSALSSIYIISFWISHFRQLSIYVLCFGHPMEYGYRLYLVLDTLWNIDIDYMYIGLDTLWNIDIEYT